MTDRKKRERKTLPSNETKEARFVRVATPRVVKAIKQIKLLSNCAASSYAYEPEQVKKMVDAIEEALANTAAAFVGKAKGEGEFSF